MAMTQARTGEVTDEYGGGGGYDGWFGGGREEKKKKNGEGREKEKIWEGNYKINLLFHNEITVLPMMLYLCYELCVYLSLLLY